MRRRHVFRVAAVFLVLTLSARAQSSPVRGLYNWIHGTGDAERGGSAIDLPDGRAILVRDPDGSLVEVRQGTRAAVSAAKSPREVIATSIGISVARLPRALEFYQGLLGLSVDKTRTAATSELLLYGLGAGTLTQALVSIPGSASATVVLSEFSLPPGSTDVATPFAWRLQDVGSPQFQLQVADLDALMARTTAAGYRFLSVGGKPIQRSFGRFVFAIDPDGVLVEFVEPR